MYIPNSNFWRPDKGAIVFKESLKSLATFYSIPFYDMTEVIDPDDRNIYAPNGGHLSPEGYRRVAERVVDILDNMNKKADN